MKSVCILVPYTRPPYGATVRQFMAIEGGDFQLSIRDLYGQAIDVARNHLLLTARDAGFDYALFVDNDASFHPGAVKRLVERELPVVCGGMWTKEYPPKPTIARYGGRNDQYKDFYNFKSTMIETLKFIRIHHGMQELKHNELCLTKTDQDLIERDGCGMHFTLINLEVLDAIKWPYFVMGTASGAGEDFYFCKKLREAGVKIYYDMSVQTGHMAGDYDIECWLGGREPTYGVREVLRHFKDVPDDKLDYAVKNVLWEVGGAIREQFT